MINDEKSDKNAKGIYVMCPLDSAIGAVSVFHLELATIRGNVQRRQSVYCYDSISTHMIYFYFYSYF